MKVYKFQCKSCGATKYKKEGEHTYKCLYCGNAEEVFLDKEKSEKSEIRKEIEELKDAFEEIIVSKEADEKAKQKELEKKQAETEKDLKKAYQVAFVNFLICLCGGWFGLHKFFERKFIIGLIYLCTCGLGLIMYAFDTLVRLMDFLSDYKKYKKCLENKNK